MELERDIVEKIGQYFSGDDAGEAIELLRAAGKSGRIARCIVFAADGKLEALKQYIQLANEDDREVISAGEYEGIRGQMRDLRASFLIDAPVKMWISEVAAVLARLE